MEFLHFAILHLKNIYFRRIFDMLTYEQALSYALAGDAIFILGSGFSIHATNHLGLPLMSGKKLAKELSIKVQMDDDTPLDIVSQEYIDQIGERSLSNYLKEQYEVAEFNECYNAFTKIKELKIYTTNYDNLIETVCQAKGKKIKSYTLMERINKCDKKNMIMHLNGYVNDLGDNIPDNFNLTHLSYNHSPLYDSPWYPYIKDEIYSSKVVFIIGLSFKSDLDLRRLINSDSEITDKCFIVESPYLSENDKSYLSKYGHVLLNGIEGFCGDLNSSTPAINERKLSSYRFKSFIEYRRNQIYKGLTDKEMFNMFFLGKVEKNAFYQNEDKKYLCLVNRKQLNDSIDLIKKGKSLIIHSDLGNGKTVFINQLLYKLSDYRIFYMLSKQNEKYNKEIEILCESDEKILIVIDPYNLHLADFEKFKNYSLKNVQFILSSRTAMHENCCNIAYDIIDQMQGVNFSVNPLNLNSLDIDEKIELNQLISRFGFWGEQTHLSEENKLDLLSNKLESKFQTILLYLFKEGQIKEKFENILRDISSDKLVMQILILSFINEILELDLNQDDFSIIFNRDNIDRILRRRRDDLGELVDYNSSRLSVKSSIISKALIGSTVLPREIILDTLLMISRRLDLLYEGNKKYSNVLKNLASASYLSFIFDYNLDSNILIEYYEKIKENNFNKQNLFFWEQYAITCVNVKDFPRAKKYFETSYSLAKKRGRGFSTFQIDNHYARFLLESQIYSRNYETALPIFIEAHTLLTKKYISDEMINDRYYQFRVAILYKEYYDVFYNTFTEKEKNIFIIRCQEMYDKLKNYLKGRQDKDYRRYIDDCQRNLEYILKL